MTKRTLLENAKLIESISLGELGNFHAIEDEIHTSVHDLIEKLEEFKDLIHDSVNIDDERISDELKQNHQHALTTIERYIAMAEKFENTLSQSVTKVLEHISDVNDLLDE